MRSLLFIIILCTTFQVSAQVGCIANIPLQPNGSMYTTFNSGGYYEVYGAKVTNPYVSFCITETGNSCQLRGLAQYAGTAVLFSPLPCSIDDYVIPMAIGIAYYGIIKLKNSQKKKVISSLTP